MRGFRASRAAVNFKTSHWGGDKHQFQPRVINGGNQEQNPNGAQKRELPEWLRMKEPEPAPRATAKTAATVKARSRETGTAVATPAVPAATPAVPAATRAVPVATRAKRASRGAEKSTTVRRKKAA